MAGLGLRRAASLLRIRFGEYVALENGQIDPTPVVIHDIASLYDIPPESVCDGPLPVPVSYDRPTYPEDDMDELALTIREAYHALWRYRQSFDEPWARVAKRLSIHLPYPPPFPYRYLRVPENIPVSFWLDVPHRFLSEIASTPLFELKAGRETQRYKLSPNGTIIPPGKLTVYASDATVLSVWPVVQ